MFFTILILTGNTMTQSIRRRIPELATEDPGILDTRVTTVLSWPNPPLLLIGGAVGMAAAVGMLPFLNGSTGGRFPPLYVETATWIGAGAVAVVLALVVGLPPAWRARRLRIVDALAGHR